MVQFALSALGQSRRWLVSTMSAAPPVVTLAEIAARLRPLDLLRQWLGAASKPHGNVKLEVDPQSFF
jgi:hypothetical protein